MRPQSRHHQSNGFTLMETVIALGIVALLLTSFLAVFGPAANNVQRAVNAEEAERLSTGLEAELNVLRASDDNYTTAFQKAFDWVALDKEKGEDLVLIYKYRADAEETTDAADSYIPAQTDVDEETIIQSAIRLLKNVATADATPEGEEQLEQVDGPVFAVQLTQLVYDDDGALVEATEEISDPLPAGTIYEPRSHEEFTEPDAAGGIFPEASIAFSAKFFLLSTNTEDYIEYIAGLTDSTDPTLEEVLGKPVFTRNMAVRR